MVQHQSLRLPGPVVVLGGGGFIGSNLVSHLEKEGYDVTSVDTQWHGFRHRGRNQRTLNLLNPYHAQSAVSGAGTVFHLAADMGGVEYFHGDADFGAAMDNGIITNNVVQACVQQGVQRLVYASSACAADTSFQFDLSSPYRIRESDILTGSPDARYGAEKRYGAYCVANAPLDGRVAMFHTVYGPGQEYEGVRRKFPSAVCTNALKAANQKSALTLFGDGGQIRTYLYISDAIDRLYSLAIHPEIENQYVHHQWLSRVFNIGATAEVSCKSVAEVVLRIIGYDAPIQYDAGKPSGVLARSCNLDKWIDTFGAPPTETTVEKGFTQFIDWLRERV